MSALAKNLATLSSKVAANEAVLAAFPQLLEQQSACLLQFNSKFDCLSSMGKEEKDADSSVFPGEANGI